MPELPNILDSFRTHPDPGMRLMGGFKKNPVQQYTGNPWADFVLRIGGQALIPPAKQAPFQASTFMRPDVAKRLVNPFYAQALNRGPAYAAAAQPGILGAMEQQIPEMGLYGPAIRDTLQDPNMLAAVPNLQGLAKYF